MNENQDIYILKPQRYVVTLSGRVLDLQRPIEAGVTTTAANEGDNAEVVGRTTPKISLFHHSV